MIQITSINNKYYVLIKYTYTYRKEVTANLLKVFSCMNKHELLEKVFFFSRNSKYSDIVLLHSNCIDTIPSHKQCINCGRKIQNNKPCCCGVERYEFI